ncbi:MAG: hypothetical protein P8J27_06525, partial [Mariniblastus sp.]|nr:hypothetical protein [Mariniblastus sp.]
KRTRKGHRIKTVVILAPHLSVSPIVKDAAVYSQNCRAEVWIWLTLSRHLKSDRPCLYPFQTLRFAYRHLLRYAV